jgi:hypothetical protein
MGFIRFKLLTAYFFFEATSLKNTPDLHVAKSDRNYSGSSNKKQADSATNQQHQARNSDISVVVPIVVVINRQFFEEI